MDIRIRDNLNGSIEVLYLSQIVKVLFCHFGSVVETEIALFFICRSQWIVVGLLQYVDLFHFCCCFFLSFRNLTLSNYFYKFECSLYRGHILVREILWDGGVLSVGIRYFFILRP